MRRSLALVLIVGTIGLACVGSQPPRSVISTNESGLRVYSWVSEWAGVQRDCGSNLRSGLKARLEGRQENTVEPLWLRADDGRTLSVVWPAGFSALFDPDAVLHDESGKVVARAGDLVHLMDVQFADASGTFDDPYIAEGGLFDGCYYYED
jgi:hypothetical protein